MDEQVTIKQLWDRMDADKSDLVARCEKYANWTIRGICPPDDDGDQHRAPSYVLIGPRLVNNLSNKILTVMFPYDRPFFSVNLSSSMKQRIRQEAGDEALSAISGQARTEARFVEDMAMDKLNIVEYRPVGVQTAQHLIVTGNSLIRRMPDGKRVLYGIKDFGVIRSISGKVLKVVVRDYLSQEELTPNMKALLAEKQPNKVQVGTNTHDLGLELLTCWVLQGNRYVQQQELEGVDLGHRQGFSFRDVPFIVLTWSLNRGDNYGRGLVEEHEALFHNLNVTTEAMIDIFNLIADVRFLVRPGTITASSLKQLNESRRGAFIPGTEGDVTPIELQKAKDLQILAQAGERMERELSYAFLMGAGTVRNAERVTALEVQMSALELEQAFGGLYSRLALEWQQREAEYLIGQLKIANIGKEQMFDAKVSTGLETLSREGELQKFREAMVDLQMFNTVPEDMRQDLNPRKVATFLFGQRGVRYEDFMYTTAEKEQLQAKQDAILQQQQAAETGGKVIEGASKEMFKQ